MFKVLDKIVNLVMLITIIRSRIDFVKHFCQHGMLFVDRVIKKRDSSSLSIQQILNPCNIIRVIYYGNTLPTFCKRFWLGANVMKSLAGVLRGRGVDSSVFGVCKRLRFIYSTRRSRFMFIIMLRELSAT